MSMLQIVNLLVFLGVTAYAVYLFASVVYRRYQYVKLGKPADLEVDLKTGINQVLVNVFGQKKLLKDKKAGSCMY